jgi:integrase
VGYDALIKSHQDRIADLREQLSAERRANEENRRTIRLTEAAVGVLREHLVRQVDEIEKLGDLYKDDGLVFTSEVGTLIDPTSFRQRSFAPLLKRAKLPPIRFLDLRHTCATLLLSKNVNPKIVSEMFGHSTISITLDTYSHVLPNMQDVAALALEDVLRTPESYPSTTPQ